MFIKVPVKDKFNYIAYSFLVFLGKVTAEENSLRKAVGECPIDYKIVFGSTSESQLCLTEDQFSFVATQLEEIASKAVDDVAVLRQVVMNLNEEMKELKASRESEPLPDVGEPLREIVGSRLMDFMNTKGRTD